MQRCAAGRRLPRRSHDFTQTGCKVADTPIGSDFGGRDDDDARARQSRLRILYASGYAKEVLVRDGRPDSGVELLAKPFTSLAERLRQGVWGFSPWRSAPPIR
ncbi:hypothetical protein M527_26735 [Sphingobium indicum IP26]|uniref:Uncharacterized protein n=1 Tax=Sphingobium indicum F2 TaxID=1450518 RepID=A0A8E0WRG8_9SPHN|nr:MULTISPECIES: hypothetical protein [Sphingobium]EPR14978.1 hypothetical protein M527_26735 [Sphingobium indicum IP26]EQB02286.1 hypothetical protein L286_14380 [Sphingobium sp. HDIP04]KER35850.1 hypothetical protein AL00_13990 [Sphingobium indicum F2]